MAIDFISESASESTTIPSTTGVVNSVAPQGIDFQVDFQPESTQLIPKSKPKAIEVKPKTLFGNAVIPALMESLTRSEPSVAEPGFMGAAKDVALGVPEAIAGLTSGLGAFIGGQVASVPTAITSMLPQGKGDKFDVTRGFAEGQKVAEKISAAGTYHPTTDTGKLLMKPIDLVFGTLLGSVENTVRQLADPTTPKEEVDKRVKASHYVTNSLLLGLPLVTGKLQKGKPLTISDFKEVEKVIPAETPPDVASAALEALRNFNIKEAVASNVKTKFEGNQSIAEGLMTEALNREGHAKGALNRVAKIVSDLEGDAKGVDFKSMKGVGPKSQALIEKFIKDRDAALTPEILPVEGTPTTITLPEMGKKLEPTGTDILTSEMDNPDVALSHFENSIPVEDQTVMADVFKNIRDNKLHEQVSFPQQLFNMVGGIYESRTGKKLEVLGGVNKPEVTVLQVKPKEIFNTDGVDVKYDGIQKFGDKTLHMFTIQEGPAKGATRTAETLNPLDVNEVVKQAQKDFTPTVSETPQISELSKTSDKIISEFDNTSLAKGEGYEIRDKRRFESPESAQRVAERKGADHEVIKIGDKYAVGKFTETAIPEYASMESLKADLEVMSEISPAKAKIEAEQPEGSEFWVAKVGDKYYRTVVKDPNAPVRPNVDFVPEEVRWIEVEAEPTVEALRTEEVQLKKDLKALVKESKKVDAPKETIRPEIANAFKKYKDRYVDKINVAKSESLDTMYHGTGAVEFKEFKDLPYLTIDSKEALGFANNKHLGGSTGGIPRALEISTNFKKVKDINAEVLKALEFGDIDEVVRNEVAKAKKLGYDAVKFDHPSMYTDGEFDVYVPTSLDRVKIKESKTTTITPKDLPVIDSNFATFKSETEGLTYKEATGKKGELIQDPLSKEWFIEPELEGFEDLGWEDGVESLTSEHRNKISDETLDYGEMSEDGTRDLFSIFSNERGAVDIIPLRIAVDKMEQVVEASKKAGKSIDEFLDMIGMSPESIAQFKTALAQMPKDKETLKSLDPITERILNPTEPIIHQTVKMNKMGEVKSVMPPITQALASKIMNATRHNIWGNLNVKVDPKSGREIANVSTGNIQRYLQATETRINAFRRFGIPEVYRDWRALKTKKELEYNSLGDEIKLKRDSLTRKEREGLAIAAYADMKGGEEAFTAMGIKSEDIPIMNTKQMEVFNWMTKTTSKMLDRVNYVRVHTGQKPIPRLLDKNGKENYLPLMRQMNVLREMGVLEGITTTDARRISSISSDYHGIFNPHAKTRKVSDIPIELDVFKAMESYLNYTLEEIYIGPLAAQVKELATVPLPKAGGKGSTMLKNYNPGLSQLLLKWSDEIMGIDRTSSIMAIENPFIRNVAQQLSKNIVVGIIGGNLQTFLKQPTALIGVYANLGLPASLYGAGRYMIEKPFKGSKSEAQTLSNSLHIRKAELIWSDFIEQMKLGTLKGGKAIATKVAFAPMDLIDSVVAEIGWNSGFHYAKGKLKLGEKDAIDYADDLVERTQGMGTRGAVSPIQASIATKWLTLLQTFGIADFNYILQDIGGFKNPDITKPQQVSRAFRYIIGAMIIGEMFKVAGLNSPFPTPVDAFVESRDEGKGIPSATFNAMMEFTEKLPVWGGSAKYGSSLGGVIGEFAQDVPEASKAVNDLMDWGSMTERQKLNASMMIAKSIGYAWGIPMTNQILKGVKTASRGGDPYQIILGIYIDEKKKKGGTPNFKLESPSLNLPKGL